MLFNACQYPTSFVKEVSHTNYIWLRVICCALKDLFIGANITGVFTTIPSAKRPSRLPAGKTIHCILPMGPPSWVRGVISVGSIKVRNQEDLVIQFVAPLVPCYVVQAAISKRCNQRKVVGARKLVCTMALVVFHETKKVFR